MLSGSVGKRAGDAANFVAYFLANVANCHHGHYRNKRRNDHILDDSCAVLPSRHASHHDGHP